MLEGHGASEKLQKKNSQNVRLILYLPEMIKT